MKWIEPEPYQIPDELRSVVGGNALIAEILARRGFKSAKKAEAFLHPEKYMPASSFDLPDLRKAACRLIDAKNKSETVLIWGDFDVDGQTATALLMLALRLLSIDVIHHVPIRERESHGVNQTVLERLLGDSESPRVQVLLTCDTGISSHEALDFARLCGIDVIITDHHDLPESLPEAYAIIDAKMLPANHPLSKLPGVGMAYKLIEGLFEELGLEVDCGQYLDLVAMGIVADVAEQIDDTRFLLQKGLERLQSTPRPGLSAMYDLMELNAQKLTEEHIAFLIAPRLNAIGRLGDAALGVELLTTDNQSRARVLALQLEGLNNRRKLLTNQVYRSAIYLIENDPRLLDEKVVVLSNPNWPAGVIGIVASRLVDQFGKPFILISSPPRETGRGSARSVVGIDISALIAQNKCHLLGFGGHPMAAGFSIEPAKIVDFRKGISKAVKYLKEIPAPTLMIDGYIELSELDLDFVRDIERLAPFGAGNPPVVLVSKKLKLEGHHTTGRDDEHLVITAEDEKGQKFNIIWWKGSEKFQHLQLEGVLFDLAYTVRSKSYQGETNIQIEWIDCCINEEQETRQLLKKSLKVIDHRKSIDPISLLAYMKLPGNFQIWAEGDAIKRFKEKKVDDRIIQKVRNREQLTECYVLIIWTIPPGFVEINKAFVIAQPVQVILFGVDPGVDELETFLTRLVGVVKYCLNKYQGKLSSNQVAASMAHKISTIERGIECLEHYGIVKVIQYEDGVFQLQEGNKQIVTGKAICTDQLKLMLEETAAFRKFFLRADKEALITMSDERT